MQNLTVAERHQLKVARDTLKLSATGAFILGGMNHAEAREIIRNLTGPAPKTLCERNLERERKTRR